MKKLLNILIILLFAFVFNACTIPPPPCVECASICIHGNTRLALPNGFIYRIHSHMANTLYCRKRYEDKV